MLPSAAIMLRGAGKTILIPLLLAVAIVALVEGAWRVAGRLRSGQWPQTRAAADRAFVQKVSEAYRRHPYYLVGGKPDAVLDIAGHRIEFDSEGRRGRNVVVPKPAGTFRIVCIGGSTTFDLLAPGNTTTWPALLGSKLGPGFEVINAGFPGWTSVESLIALELRDIDLQPDLVIAFSGINDLQPGSHTPFASDYSVGHGEFLPRVLGKEPIPLPFASRFVFIEWLLDRMAPRRDQTPGFSPVWRWGGAREEEIQEPARATFRRNLISTIGVARAHGSDVLFAAQAARLRSASPGDTAYVESWIPGLSAAGIVRGIERYNDTAAQTAAESGEHYTDPFAGGTFSDADFGDPYHFSAAGSERFAAALEPVVRAIAHDAGTLETKTER